jgi:outer membrane protein OmpA-like peptidoglycan-associated protein
LGTLSPFPEFAVGPRYLACLSLIACSLATAPALAFTFQTRLENVEWKVEGDAFECRLTQPVTDFGEAQFIRRAGEKAFFRLSTSTNALGTGTASLMSAAAPWQPGRGDISLGAARLSSGPMVLTSSQGQASGLISGLLEGRSAVVRAVSTENGQAMDVRVLPVKFSKAWSDYQVCAGKLLPMNFDQVRMTQVPFPGTGVDLDSTAKARLDVILAFLKADPSVNHIELDGHSDNSGNRLTNRELSRRRALSVADYLKAHGIPEDHIDVRFHGEQYPVVPNTSPANRARNRRVNIQLDKRPVTESITPSAQAPATPVSTPAAAPAAPAAGPSTSPAQPAAKG